MSALPKDRKQAEKLRKLSSNLSTLFAAPEMLDESDYAGVFDPQAADVWALGVCLYAFIFEEMPFKNKTEILGQRRPACPYNKPVSKECMSLLKALLQRDPESRPTMQQAREQFEWLQPDKPAQQNQYFWRRCINSE